MGKQRSAAVWEQRARETKTPLETLESSNKNPLPSWAMKRRVPPSPPLVGAANRDLEQRRRVQSPLCLHRELSWELRREQDGLFRNQPPGMWTSPPTPPSWR